MRRIALALVLLLTAAMPAEDMASGDEAWDNNDVATAMTQWSIALRSARDIEDEDLTFELRLRLAAAHRETNNLDTARVLLDAAAPTAQSDIQRARVALARGLVHRQDGELSEALRRMMTAFGLAKRGRDASLVATIAHNVGLVRFESGDVTAALHAYRTSLKVTDPTSDGSGGFDTYVELSRALLRHGTLAQASVAAMHALGGDLAAVAEARAVLGRIAWANGDLAGATEHLLAALTTARARTDVALQASLLSSLAGLALATGDAATAQQQWGAAETALRQAGQESAARSVALDRASALDELDVLRDLLAQAIAQADPTAEARASLYIAEHDRSMPLAARAAELAERLSLPDVGWRAAHLRGELLVESGSPNEAIPYLDDALARLQRLRSAGVVTDADQAAGRTSLAAALIATDNAAAALGVVLHTPDADPAAHLVTQGAAISLRLTTETDPAQRTRLARMRVAFAQELDQLRASTPDLDTRTRIAPEELEALQADLPSRTLVVAPILLDDEVVILTLARSGVAVTRVPSTDVSRRIGRLMRALRAGLIDDDGWAQQQGDALGELLLAPIADQLTGVDTLVFAVNGPFRQLPLSILRLNGAPVSDTASVVAITHSTSLMTRQRRRQVIGSDIVLVGNPDGTLPGASREVAQIHSRFPASRVLIESAATLDAVREASQGHRILHLATHGRIDPEVPERSHLVMAGDTSLTYREIPGLAPWLTETDIIILSACESGVPVQANGLDEEGRLLISIEGLAAQFRRAGVETLVASLWKVNDEATTALMVALYAELAQGTDIHKALASAQTAVRSQTQWEHPYYWAAFTVVGNWQTGTLP